MNLMKKKISITEADAIKEKSILNLIKKVTRGGILTKQEENKLDEYTDELNVGTIGTYAKNQVELANAIGVDRKTIYRWKQEPSFPKAKPDGRINIQEVVNWKENNGITSGDLSSKESAQVASINLNNEKLKLQIGILKGEYTENTIIASQVTEMVLSAKRELLALPSSLAPQVVGESVAGAEKIIKNAINDALRSLSNNQIVNDKNSSS